MYISSTGNWSPWPGSLFVTVSALSVLRSSAFNDAFRSTTDDYGLSEWLNPLRILIAIRSSEINVYMYIVSDFVRMRYKVASVLTIECMPHW